MTNQHTLSDQSIVKFVKNIVSLDTDITPNQMESKTRKREIAFARQVAMHLISAHTSLSLKSIGFEFGFRDHSTVIHAKQTIQDLRDTDKKVQHQITMLEESVEKYIRTQLGRTDDFVNNIINSVLDKIGEEIGENEVLPIEVSDDTVDELASLFIKGVDAVADRFGIQQKALNAAIKNILG